MDYISTKELAKRWNISITRVLNLVKAGRLPGAKLIGKSWVFPNDIKKPEDMRKKHGCVTVDRPVFRFPIYLYYPYTHSDIENGFTESERKLFLAEQRFFHGDFEEPFDQLEQLVRETDDRYVRFGALYCLCLSGINTHRYARAVAYHAQIQSLFSEEVHHKKELEFLIHDLETYFLGNQYYLDGFKMDILSNYPEHMKAYLIVESAYSDMLKSVVMGIPTNALPYEYCLECGRKDFSPLSELLFHLYIAAIYIVQGDKEKGGAHLRRSCRIAEENEMEHSIASLLHYAKEAFDTCLGEHDPEQLKRLKTISGQFIEALHGLFEYSRKNNVLRNLDAKDSTLIEYARQGLTNKEIAAILNLSINTISKRYALLYNESIREY